jgi:hypothetical protein
MKAKRAEIGGGWLWRLRALRRDEEGQSLIFGVLSIFVVLFFVSMILNVGEVTARRIQLQLAADSAAYSSTALEAQILNSMTLVNAAMAQVRARALRYAVDVNAYGVLAELRDQYLLTYENADRELAQQITVLTSQLQALQQQLADAQAQTPPDQDLIDQLQNQIQVVQQQIAALTTARSQLHENGDVNAPLLTPDPTRVVEVVGIDGADERYAEAYGRAEEWRDACNEWLKELSRLEYTMAILAPRLAGEVAYEMVEANGGRYANVFPSQRWHPRGEAYDAWTCERLGDDWWRLSHVGGGTVIEARKEDCGDCEGCRVCGGSCQSCWVFRVIEGASMQLYYKLCDLGENARGEHLWLVENLAASGDDRYTCILQHEELVVVRWGPRGLIADRLPGTDPPVYMIQNESGVPPDNTIFFRHSDGYVQQATYKKDASGNYIRPLEYPDDDDFQNVGVTRMQLGGVPFNVNFDPYVALPGSARIWITVPPAFERSWDDGQGNRGHIRINFTNPISMNVSVAGISFWVRDDRFGFGRRGHILTIDQADGIPRKFFDRGEEYWWEHQLTPTGPNEWLYEYKEFGAMLEPETNAARLLAFRDIERQGIPDIEQTEWAAAAAVPSWAYDDTWNTSGWLNTWTGALQPNTGADVTVDESQYAFYQKRPCWDPNEVLDANGEPTGQWQVTDPDGNAVLITCPTCGGRGYVVVGAEEVFGRHGRLSRSDPDPYLGQQGRDYQEAELDTARAPLVLSEEWFKFGTTVGAWRGRDEDFRDAQGNPLLAGTLEYLLHDPTSGLKGIFGSSMGAAEPATTEPVYYPEWGYFTLAAARARLRDGSQDPNLLQGCRFEDVDARENWVDNNLYNLYPVARRNALGQPYYGYWDARLLSLDRQILTEDVVLGPNDPAQTGTAWLMGVIARGAARGSRQAGFDYPAGWTDTWDGRDVSDVRELLTRRLRPRRPYGSVGRPYIDAQGALRDPFVEMLVGQDRSDRRTGGQLNYDQMDSESVLH